MYNTKQMELLPEADDILPDDIKSVLRDAVYLKQRFNNSICSQHELEDTTKLLQQEVDRSRESEEKGRSTLNMITQEMSKLQCSLSELVDTKQENMVLRARVKENETKIRDLNLGLEKERLSCHQLMQKSRMEFEDQAAKNLSYTQAEADSLREQLMSLEEQLRKKTQEIQIKLRNMEHSKTEEIKHLTYDFQEKINKLQSALTATQAENRNIRDRLQFNTTMYQKKMQELERYSSPHPALRNPPSGNRGKKALPQLQFLATEQLVSEEPANTENQVEKQNNATAKKRRKLFTQKNCVE